MDIELTVADDVPQGQMHEVRRQLERLEKIVDPPPPAVRLTLRGGGGGEGRHVYVADATAPYARRLVAAHVTGPTVLETTERAVERLRRQLRRVIDADVALRNEPRTLAKAVEDLGRQTRMHPDIRLKPPEQRRIVHHRAYADRPEPTLTAVADLLDDDEQFHLFVHVRTNEDVVVHWRDDGRIGLLFPRGSVLADENDVVVPEPSRDSEPRTLAQARAEEDFLNHRFLYFIDAEDNRGKVLYPRFDGDYGLVEPA
jgi:ribosome-associated translation inhibitor RaiA